MKNRLKAAQTGHSLLKRKSEALTRRFRDILKKIVDVRISSSSGYSDINVLVSTTVGET